MVSINQVNFAKYQISLILWLYEVHCRVTCHQKRMTKKRVISDLMRNFHKNQLATKVFQMPLNLHIILKVHGMWSPLWGRQNFPMGSLSCWTMKPTPLLSSLSRPGALLTYLSTRFFKNYSKFSLVCENHLPGTSWTLAPRLWLRATLIRLLMRFERFM